MTHQKGWVKLHLQYDIFRRHFHPTQLPLSVPRLWPKSCRFLYWLFKLSILKDIFFSTVDNCKVSLQIWDTAGQGNYQPTC